jgi:hypothetical protein
MSFLNRTAIALVISFAVPALASAKEMVISPFLPRSVDKLVALNITSLVSSELDFSPDYEAVTQLETLPKGMSVSCVNQASCLRPIGRSHNANHLIAGSVAPSGRSNFQVYLVLFDVDGGTFIRKKAFTISRSPDVMADSIANVVNVLITGKDKEAPIDDSVIVDDGSFDDFVDGEDDFSFEEEPTSHRMNLPGSSTNTLDDFEDEEDDFAINVPTPAEKARRKAEEAERERVAEEAAKRQERERQRAEAARRKAEAKDAKRRADEERRREAEAEAQRRKDEIRREERAEARRRESESTFIEEEEFDDVDDFEFGSVSTDDIGIDDIEFGSAVGMIEEDRRIDDLDDLGLDYGTRSPVDSLDDLDDEKPTRKAERSKRKSSSTAKRSRKRTSSINAPFVSQGNSQTLTARAGFSQFQSLNFLTYGAEMVLPMGDRTALTVGLELQSTKRMPSPAQQIQFNLPPELWNTIMPINVGGLYRFGQGRIQPFVGADVILTPYTRNFNVALGARARLGADVMLTKTFGMNVSLSTGAWYGSKFTLIDEGLKNFGIVPQGTLGTSILF